MGAGRPWWAAILKIIHRSTVCSWLAWGSIWTAALGLSFFLSLQAAAHQSWQAAAVIEDRAWHYLIAGNRLLLLYFSLWLMGAGLLGAGIVREQKLRGRQRQIAADLEREQALREQLDACPDGLCIVRDNIVRYANHQLAAMIGIPVPELTASPLTSFLPADELVGFSQELGRLAAAPGGVRFDSTLLHRDGPRLEVEVHAGSTIQRGRRGRICFIDLGRLL